MLPEERQVSPHRRLVPWVRDRDPVVQRNRRKQGIEAPALLVALLVLLIDAAGAVSGLAKLVEIQKNALVRLGVEGRVALRTASWIGTLALKSVAVTFIDLEYWPGAASWGTSTSIQATRFSFAGTSIGKALRW